MLLVAVGSMDSICDRGRWEWIKVPNFRMKVDDRVLGSWDVEVVNTSRSVDIESPYA